jgi:hypothetical protein
MGQQALPANILLVNDISHGTSAAVSLYRY